MCTASDQTLVMRTASDQNCLCVLQVIKTDMSMRTASDQNSMRTAGDQTLSMRTAGDQTL